MKVDYQEEVVYATYLCDDTNYVLVTKDKKKESGLFKVNLTDLSGLNEKNLGKLKKFIK
jgi:hypothetical protein